MVWGYFAGIRRDDLLRVCNWKMRKENYLGILESSALPPGSLIIDQPFTCQRKNDSQHAAKYIKIFWKKEERQDKFHQ